MYAFISHIKFIFSATNQHGVHSPFVYSYVTKCLYSKKKHSKKKSLNILLKSISYFSVSSIKINEESNFYKHFIKKQFPELKTKATAYDIIYIEEPNAYNSTIEEKELKNTSMIFIEGIYKNKKANERWKQITKQKEITVSIDLFYCGVLFTRKEQVKEHFKIRS